MKKFVYLLSSIFLLAAGITACSSHDLYEDPEQPKSHQMEGQGENDTTDYSKETIPPVEANAEVKEFFENALKMVDGENDFFYNDECLHAEAPFSKCIVINDQKDFSGLYRGNKSIPKIDFNKYSLIVGVERIDFCGYYFNIIKQTVTSGNDGGTLTLYYQREASYCAWRHYTNVCYWGIYPKVMGETLKIKKIHVDSENEKFISSPYTGNPIPINLKETNDIPNSISSMFNKYKDGYPVCWVFEGKWSNENIYMFYSPLMSSFGEYYYKKGNKLNYDEVKVAISESSDWSCIYIL